MAGFQGPNPQIGGQSLFNGPLLQQPDGRHVLDDPSNDPALAKAKAVRFLEQTIDDITGLDGNRRFVMIRNGDSQSLFTRSRFVAFFQPDSVVAASAYLSVGLAGLKHLCMNKAEQRCFDTIFKRINSSDVNGDDIRTLDRMVQRILKKGKPGERAYYRLQEFRKAARAGDPYAHISLSDDIFQVTFETRVGKTDRLNAGEYMRQELEPLRDLIQADGNGTDVRKFDDYLKKIEKGEFQSKDMLRFARFVDLVMRPKTHAILTVNRIGKMARRAGHGKSIVWDASLGDYKIESRWYVWDKERRTVGHRLAEELRGLDQLFYHSKDRLEYARIKEEIERGAVKSHDLRKLKAMVNKQQDSVRFARKQLRSLYKIARHAPDRRAFVWDGKASDVELATLWQSWFESEGGVYQAMDEINYRLEGLRELFTEDTPLDTIATSILDRMGPKSWKLNGNADPGQGLVTSTDIKHLMQLVETRDKLVNRDVLDADRATKNAREYLDKLARAPKAGESVGIGLVALQRLIRQNRPSDLGRFNELLEKIGKPNGENVPETIRGLANLVSEVENNPDEVRRLQPPNDGKHRKHVNRKRHSDPVRQRNNGLQPQDGGRHKVGSSGKPKTRVNLPNDPNISNDDGNLADVDDDVQIDVNINLRNKSHESHSSSASKKTEALNQIPNIADVQASDSEIEEALSQFDNAFQQKKDDDRFNSIEDINKIKVDNDDDSTNEIRDINIINILGSPNVGPSGKIGEASVSRMSDSSVPNSNQRKSNVYSHPKLSPIMSQDAPDDDEQNNGSKVRIQGDPNASNNEVHSQDDSDDDVLLSAGVSDDGRDNDAPLGIPNNKNQDRPNNQ